MNHSPENIRLKISYGNVTRRLQQSINPDRAYADLCSHAAKVFQLRQETITLEYTDDDGDIITCTSELEFKLAIEYRIIQGGLDFKFKVLSTSPQAQVDSGYIHDHVTCDECGQSPIVGSRFKCAIRKNFDLCSNCEGRSVQPFPMLKIYNPDMAPSSMVIVIGDEQFVGTPCDGLAPQQQQHPNGHVLRGGRGRGCGPNPFVPTHNRPHHQKHHPHFPQHQRHQKAPAPAQEQQPSVMSQEELRNLYVQSNQWATTDANIPSNPPVAVAVGKCVESTLAVGAAVGNLAFSVLETAAGMASSVTTKQKVSAPSELSMPVDPSLRTGEVCDREVPSPVAQTSDAQEAITSPKEDDVIVWRVVTGPSRGGSANWMAKNGETMFHFNPRPHLGCIVLNTFKNGSWGPEERINSLPPGNSNFEVHIVATSRGFEIFFEGDTSPRYVYAHRLPWTSFAEIKRCFDGPVADWKVELVHPSDAMFGKAKEPVSYPEIDEVLQSFVSVSAPAAEEEWLEIYATEVRILSDMGFDDLDAVLPILLEAVQTPVSRNPDLNGKPRPDEIQHAVALLLNSSMH